MGMVKDAGTDADVGDGDIFWLSGCDRLSPNICDIRYILQCNFDEIFWLSGCDRLSCIYLIFDISLNIVLTIYLVFLVAIASPPYI